MNLKHVWKFQAGFALALGFFAHSQPAKATTVTAVICTGADFLCNLPGDVVVDAGIRSNGVGILPANTYSILPFVFGDALMSFTGEVVTADSRGRFIYSWGTGTATAFAPGGLGLYLDVTISQNYVTVPGLWGFSEIDVGTCNGAAAADFSTSLMEGVVNGATLPVLGAIGDCAVAPFAYAAGPFARNVGLITNMTPAAQFFFAPGPGGNQSITLPWGSDFPDPDIQFNDPDNPFNFITNTDIPAGFTELTPEPGTTPLLGGGLMIMLSCWRLRGSRRKS